MPQVPGSYFGLEMRTSSKVTTHQLNIKLVGAYVRPNTNLEMVMECMKMKGR